MNPAKRYVSSCCGSDEVQIAVWLCANKSWDSGDKVVCQTDTDFIPATLDTPRGYCNECDNDCEALTPTEFQKLVREWREAWGVSQAQAAIDAQDLYP